MKIIFLKLSIHIPKSYSVQFTEGEVFINSQKLVYVKQLRTLQDFGYVVLL
jgi:hypothetical protein